MKMEFSLINVRDAVDLHIHSSPCLFPRLGDDVELVEDARRMGLREVLLKSHNESTVSRASMAERADTDNSVFACIVLNSYVGGINPLAVEAALRLGAVQVWMPTIDAAHHRKVYGGEPGITVLGSDGRLTDDVVAILELVAEHDAILGTAH